MRGFNNLIIIWLVSNFPIKRVLGGSDEEVPELFPARPYQKSSPRGLDNS